MWRCEMNDGATEEQVMQGAQEWLAAARTMKGGENFDLYANFPVAVNATGQMDAVRVHPILGGELWALEPSRRSMDGTRGPKGLP